MRKILPTFILSILLGCGQTHKQEPKANNLFFQALIFPAFDEHAEVTVSKIDSEQKIQFLLRDAYGNDKPSDTFYFKTATLSEDQFQKIDSELFQKTISTKSLQKEGIRDGIWIGFTFAHNGDTSTLSFDNPQEGIDSTAFEIIKGGIANFQSIFNDTIINEYLYDIETYIDHSKKDTPLKGQRAIDKLRRIKYSR
jgi:hypothetical protein